MAGDVGSEADNEGQRPSLERTRAKDQPGRRNSTTECERTHRGERPARAPKQHYQMRKNAPGRKTSPGAETALPNAKERTGAKDQPGGTNRSSRLHSPKPDLRPCAFRSLAWEINSLIGAARFPFFFLKEVID